MNSFLKSEEKSQIIQKIKKFFHEKDEIVSVYLFGSVRTGNVHDESDLDIGIIFKNKFSAKERRDFCYQYITELNFYFKVDIVDMNFADYPVIYEILKNGMLITEHDHDQRLNFEVLKIKQYADMQYYEKIMFDGLKKRTRKNLKNYGTKKGHRQKNTNY